MSNVTTYLTDWINHSTDNLNNNIQIRYCRVLPFGFQTSDFWRNGVNVMRRNVNKLSTVDGTLFLFRLEQKWITLDGRWYVCAYSLGFVAQFTSCCRLHFVSWRCSLLNDLERLAYNFYLFFYYLLTLAQPLWLPKTSMVTVTPVIVNTVKWLYWSEISIFLMVVVESKNTYHIY